MNLTLSTRNLLLPVARYGGLISDLKWDDGKRKWAERTDLCSLFWCTLWGLVRAPFWVLLFGVMGAAVGFTMAGYPLIAILAWLIEGLAIDELAGWVFTWWAIAVPTVTILWAYITGRFSRPLDAVRYTTSSAGDFLRAGYQSWRQKTCILVDLKEV
jgi:hypothetical protein